MKITKVNFLVGFLMLFFATFLTSAQLVTKGKTNTWTKSEVSVNRETATDTGSLRFVRAGKNDGFERVVFEFADEVPMFEVKYANPPFYYGESEDAVKISGKSFVQIMFTPARTFDLDTGKTLVTEPKKSKVGFPLMQEIKRIYDFEGQVQYVVGLKSKREFRVTELKNPARLIVDFK